MSRGWRDDAGKRANCMTEQRDWQKDMERVESFADYQQWIDDPEPIEIALKYWLQQSARWKAEAYKSEVTSHEYKKNFNDCFELLERIKKEVDEFRSLLNIDIIECASVIDQVSAFNEYIQQQRERADIAELAYQGLAESAVSRGEYESLLDKHTAMTKAYRAEKERVDKLGEAIEWVRQMFESEWTYELGVGEVVDEIIIKFDSLYPKEEAE